MKNEESRMPGISIIIPVYNSEKYLRACLDSALAQTLEDIEILCVDDGSKDGSADIIRDYQKRTDRIVLLQQENRGAAAARNRGLERAEGEYIFFLDSDDRIAAPDTLEKLCGAAKRHGTDIAGGSLLREKGGAVSGDFTGTRKNYTFTGEGVMSYRDYQYDLGFFRFIYKRDLFEDRTCLFPSYRVFEDPVFMVRIFTRAGRFAHIPDPVYIYRDTEKSLSGSLSSDRLLDMLSALQENLAFALEHDLSKLYVLTYIHLNRESRSNLEYALNDLDPDRKLFEKLIEINGQLRFDLLPEGEERVLYPLQMVYLEYRKYEKIRRSPLAAALRKMSAPFRKKQKK
jgi:glycosyltransferase involved in cell wall biosynthesis